ncbi:hypothetical protein, partial [Actinomadura bangladeshensis]
GDLRPRARQDDEPDRALGRLFVAGVDPDWDAVLPTGGPRVELPTYPFQRERYWLEGGTDQVGGGAVPFGGGADPG